MNTIKDKHSPAWASAQCRQRQVRLFFLIWTAFALLTVSWLVRQAGEASISPDLVINEGNSSDVPLADRIRNWLQLADLNFHGIYPWILLAPYVLWLGSRFHLESGGWRIGLPLHLAGCALFVIVCNLLAAQSGWGHTVIIRVASERALTQSGPNGTFTTKHLTNGLTIVTGGTSFSTNWTGAGFGRNGEASFPPGAPSTTGGAMGWKEPGGGGWHESFFHKQWTSNSFSNLLNILAYAGIVGLAHAVHFYRQSKEREGRAAALEAQLTKARLNALQAQLHPHFLFNALNAISTLLRRDTRAAQDALASFSDLLRMALSQSTQPEVLLREDVEFLRRYVEIQQTRLGDRLRYEEAIELEALDSFVPALLLQPLVENSIRHGIEPSSEAGFVRVAARAENDKLLVTVEDSGAGLATKATGSDSGIGIGLQNLRSRLESLYGARQRLEIDSRPGGGVAIRVEIPLRRTPDVETVPAMS